VILSQTVFSGLSMGQLVPSQFALNTVTGAGPQIVYNSVSGALYYDSNGATAGGTTQCATLTGAPLIAASNLFVV
jgi:serralysin